MAQDTLEKPIVVEAPFNPYKNLEDIRRLLGFGESFTRQLMKDFEEYNEDNPATYGKVSIDTGMDGSRKRYYNIYVIYHYFINRTKLELDVDVPFNLEEEENNYHKRILIERDTIINQEIIDEYLNRMSGG